MSAWRRLSRDLVAFATQPPTDGTTRSRVVGQVLRLLCALVALGLIFPAIVLVGVVLYAVDAARAFAADGALLEGVAAGLALLVVGGVLAVGSTLVAATGLLWLANRVYLAWAGRAPSVATKP